jgi:hypothetical protein
LTSGSIVAICISGYAALIATCVFVWNVYSALSDKGKIKIGGFFGHLVDGSGYKKKILYFDFVNHGKKPIKITTFAGNYKRKFVKNGMSDFIITTVNLPVKLEPGDVHQITFDVFNTIDESVKSLFVIDSLSKRHKMSKALLKHLKKSKKTFV